MTDTFAKAYVALQAALPVVPKTAENPHFRSKFADLATIVQTTRPVLAAHGFAICQEPGFREVDGAPTLVTTLIHDSGGERRSEMLLCMAKTDPQAQGSGLSYARRYAYSAILGIVTDEDDDGNKASEVPRQEPARQQTTRRPPPRPAAPVPDGISTYDSEPF